MAAGELVNELGLRNGRRKGNPMWSGETEEPNPLCARIAGITEQWLEDREKCWDSRTDVPLAGFWREKADEFAKAMMKSATNLQGDEELDEKAPVDLWQEWLEQYDPDTARRVQLEGIQPAMQKVRRELQSCRDAKKRKGLEEVLAYGEELASRCAEALLAAPPDENRHILRLVWERIAAELAMEFSEMLDDGATRMLHLWALFLEDAPSSRCVAFLRRVSRCYVWGFEPECIIMCRSALEAAFDAEVPTDDCIDVLGEEHRPRREGVPVYDLCDRVHVAKQKGFINSDAKAKADRVREAGNAVVHRRPLPPKGPQATLGAIRETLDVIRALCGRANRK